MWKSIYNWWHRYELLDAQYAAALASNRDKSDEIVALRNDLAAQTELAESTAAQLQTATDQLHEINQVKQEQQTGTTPYFSLSTSHLDDVKGLEIQMDWNPAFIQYLKDNGHTGRVEEEYVQRWLTILYTDMIEQMEKRIIDEIDITNNPSPYK